MGKPIFNDFMAMFLSNRKTNFFTKKRKNKQNRTIWSFGIEFIEGEKIVITSLGQHAEDYESKYVYPLNVFIGKELPSCQLNFELQDESENEIN